MEGTRYSCASTLSSKPESWKFLLAVWQTTSKKSTGVRALSFSSLKFLVVTLLLFFPSQ